MNKYEEWVIFLKVLKRIMGKFLNILDPNLTVLKPHCAPNARSYIPRVHNVLLYNVIPKGIGRNPSRLFLIEPSHF